MAIRKCKEISQGCYSARNQPGHAPAGCGTRESRQQQHACLLCRALMPAGEQLHSHRFEMMSLCLFGMTQPGKQ